MTSLQLLIYEDQSNADVTKKNFITVEQNNKKQIQKFVKFQKNLNIQLIKKKNDNDGNENSRNNYFINGK